MIDSNCPQCLKNDQSKLVSVIVSYGKTKGSFSGPTGGVAYSDGKLIQMSGWTSLHGYTISDLARILEQPPEPKKKGGLGLWWIATLPVWFISCAGPIWCMVGLAAFAALFSNSGTTESRLKLEGMMPNMVGLIIGGSLAFIVGLIILFLISTYDRRLNKTHQKEYLVEKTAWDRAVEYWKSLYFCERDGIVFDQITKNSCRPDQIADFVYSRSK